MTPVAYWGTKRIVEVDKYRTMAASNGDQRTYVCVLLDNGDTDTIDIAQVTIR